MEIYREGPRDEPEEDLEDVSEERREGAEEIPPAFVFRSIMMIQMAALAVAILWGMIRKIHWWESLILDSSVFWGVLLGLGLALTNQGAWHAARKLKVANIEWILSDVFHPLFRNMRIGEIVAVSALSGLCEESLFRGVLQHEWGIVISSLIFGLLHTGDRRLIAAGLWTILSSLILGYSYIMSGNLLVPVCAHAVNNLCGIIYIRYLYVRNNSAG